MWRVTEPCPFCAIAAGDVSSAKVAEDESTLAFMDINPASDGHLLVVPKRHSRDLLDIPAQDLADVVLVAQRLAGAAVEELGADGVNVLNCCGVEGGQTVFHFHLHVIPRYADKTKDRVGQPWQPGVPGDPSVIADLGRRLAGHRP